MSHARYVKENVKRPRTLKYQREPPSGTGAACFPPRRSARRHLPLLIVGSVIANSDAKLLSAAAAWRQSVSLLQN